VDFGLAIDELKRKGEGCEGGVREYECSGGAIMGKYEA
jgi:hypothetical protein